MGLPSMNQMYYKPYDSSSILSPLRGMTSTQSSQRQ
jgi:hypothetical protein